MLDCQRAKRMAEAAKLPKQPVKSKTGSRTASRFDDRKVGNTVAPTVSTNPKGRTGDRHSPGYQRDLMRARRALAVGRAERWPRTLN